MSKINNECFMRWSSVIATMATTVLALTALVTVYLTISAWKVQQNASRPYFVLKESPKIDLGNEFSLELRFNNVGIHPAVNLSSETIIFGESLSGKPIHHDESAIVNEIYKNAESSLIMSIPNDEIYPKQSNIDAHYVVVDLQYVDPILNNSYNQIIYMKWNGVKEGELQPIVHVRAEEKTKILEYFTEHAIDPTMRGE